MGELINLQEVREARKLNALEICVNCKNSTNIRRDEPIDLRPNYVEGVGQFCVPCYKLNIIQTMQFAEALDRGIYS